MVQDVVDQDHLKEGLVPKVPCAPSLACAAGYTFLLPEAQRRKAISHSIALPATHRLHIRATGHSGVAVQEPGVTPHQYAVAEQAPGAQPPAQVGHLGIGARRG